ncbi:MAG TPA: hypothetical protein VHM91_05675 [Verrucomicrobiales bacterium]|jgi:hypothetical protein|nr:hypothetical protein [Verrucomicrobiales bacterium]
MKRYTVICHRCGKSTFVDLTKTVSDQRCRSCRGFLQGVDVSVGDKPKERRRKTVWRMPGAARNDPVWKDELTPVIPVRKRWPRYFRWIVIGGLTVFLGAIGWSGILKFKHTLGGKKEFFAQEEPPKPDIRETVEWRGKAISVARKAISARTVDELLPFLFHPEISDETIREYYTGQQSLPLGKDLVEQFIIVGRYTENVVLFQYLNSADKASALTLVEKPDGMKIDWPSLTGWGEMPLRQYTKDTPGRGVVIRARARLGQYYNGAFSDSKKWLSVRLCDLAGDDVIHGYVDRAYTLASDMESILPDNPTAIPSNDKPVILILKYPEKDVKPDQTRISALLSDTWYQPNGLKAFIEIARQLDEKPKEPEKPKNAPPEGESPKEESSAPAPAPSPP